MSFAKYCYQLYKYLWCAEHLPNARMAEVYKEYLDFCYEEDLDMTFEEYLMEYGFQGECYVSFPEFLDNEYRDQEYMASILDDEKYQAWLANNF